MFHRTKKFKTQVQLTAELRACHRRIAELEANSQQHPLQDPESAQIYEQYRLLAENVADVIWVMDLELNLVYVSPSIERLMGYTAQEFIKLSLEQYLTPSSTEIVRKVYDEMMLLESQNALAANQTLTMELEFIHRNSSIVQVELNISILRSRDGKPQRFLGVTRDISMRKQAEEALRDLLENYKKLLQNVPTGIALFNYQCEFLFINEPAARAIGKPPDEIVGKTQWDIFPPEIAEVQMRNIRKVIDTREEFRGDVKTYINNEWRWYRTIIQPFKNTTNQKYDALLIVDDINERKAAEAALILSRDVLEKNVAERNIELQREVEERQRAEARLRLLSIAVEQSSEGILVCDMGGILIYVNPYCARIHGYSPEELVGKHLSIFHAPEQMEAVQQASEKTVATGEFSGELWQVRRDGSSFPGSVHGTIFRDEDSNPIGVIGTVLDITDKKQAELSLKASEERYRTLVETMREGLIIGDESGRITFVNERFCEILGFSSNELIGESLTTTTVVDTQNRALVGQELEKRRRGIAEPYEIVLKRKNGDRIDAFISPGVIFDQFGQFKGSFGVITDITARKRTEAQLHDYSEKLESMVAERTARIQELERQRAESEKLAAAGRIAARIAHEINNPLAGIKNSFKLVAGALPSDHQYYSYIERIDKEIDRIARIVQQMYRLYKPETDAVQEFILSEVIGDIAALLEPRCHEDNISLETDCRGVNQKVKIPENLLRQILYNVVMNAIEASPPGSAVIVKSEIIDNRIIMTISDQGAGIAAEIKNKIFEPFFTTKRESAGAGLGLGLSITKNLVDTMRGTISFNSEQGTGTTFRIEIPQSDFVQET